MIGELLKPEYKDGSLIAAAPPEFGQILIKNSKIDSVPDLSALINRLAVGEKERVVFYIDNCLRTNGVYKMLAGSNHWYIKDISIRKVYLQQAEPRLAYIFKRNNFHLMSIAEDDGLWEHSPYSNYDPNRKIEYPILLGIKEGHGAYRLFDGAHRAIQAARSGQNYLKVCYCKK